MAEVQVTVNPKFVQRLVQAAAGFVEYAGQQYAADVQAYMRTSTPAGRTYVIKGRVHRASAPGQPPAQFTGDLVRAVRSVFTRTATGGIAVIGVGKEAGREKASLEFGTQRVLPRPAFRPQLPITLRRLRQDLAKGASFFAGGL